MAQSVVVRDYRPYYFSVAVAILALDQFTKCLVIRYVDLQSMIVVVPGFFNISHVLNRGAAFSLFAESSSQYTPILLILFSLSVLTFVSIILWRSGPAFKASGLALSLILGGALGNLLDRIRIGSVVDFLMFKLGPYHWPDFNIADSAIVVGSIFLISEIFLHPRDHTG